MRFEVCLWQISVKFTKKEQNKKNNFYLLCFISFYVLVMRQQPHFCSSNTYYNTYQSHIWGYWLVQGILSQYIFCLLCVLRSCKTSERNKELFFFKVYFWYLLFVCFCLFSLFSSEDKIKVTARNCQLLGAQIFLTTTSIQLGGLWIKEKLHTGRGWEKQSSCHCGRKIAMQTKDTTQWLTTLFIFLCSRWAEGGWWPPWAGFLAMLTCWIFSVWNCSNQWLH